MKQFGVTQFAKACRTHAFCWAHRSIHGPCHRISFRCWAEAHIKIARMTLTIKLDGNWNSFQLANNTPPLSVTGSVIAPSARMLAARAEPSIPGSNVLAHCFILSLGCLSQLPLGNSHTGVIAFVFYGRNSPPHMSITAFTS